MVKVCECCGHPVPAYDALSGLTMGQQKIFAALEKAGQAGISRQRLFDKIYGGRADGGPLWIGTISVQKSKMRDALAKHGLKITSTLGGRNTMWKLEKIG